MNKTQAHTPGPWSVDSTDLNLITADCDGEAVAEVLGERSEKEMDANARLIAAAPETAAELERVKAVNVELREALKEISERADSNALEFPDAEDETRVAFVRLRDDATLALSRAEGV